MRNQGTREIVLKGTLDKGLYRFLVKHSSANPHQTQSVSSFNKARDHPSVNSASFQPTSQASTHSVLDSTLSLWHKRLGHPTLNIVKNILNGCNIPFQSMESNSLCSSCCVSKSHRLPYSLSETTYSAPLELIHSDLWGSSPFVSRNGYCYYVSFIDQFNRYCWIYVLKRKSDVASVLSP